MINRLMRRISHQPLLVFTCGVLVAVVGGVFLGRVPLAPITEVPQSEKPHLIGRITSAEDGFAKGQYYFNHGSMADGTYDLFLARQYFSAALAADPEVHELAWYQLGRIDFLESQFEAAITKFERQSELFSDQVPNVYYMLGLTHGFKARREGGSEDWLLAEEYFTRFLEYDPDLPWTRVDLAWVLFSQDKFAEMVPILEPAVELHPDNPWVLNMYGLALLNTQGKETARPYFERAAVHAADLTPADWGAVYPGNNPAVWQQGIDEFRDLIDKNVALTKEGD